MPYYSMVAYTAAELSSKIEKLQFNIASTKSQGSALVRSYKASTESDQLLKVESYKSNLLKLHRNLRTYQGTLGQLKLAQLQAAGEELRRKARIAKVESDRKAYLVKAEAAIMLKAAKRRKRLLSKTSLHNGFYGIYQDLIDGRLPIDIDYFKSKFEVITENGESLLVHKGTRHPASWRGKTNHHVTLNDYSQGVHRFRIYKTHRIVYAIHTGVDCVESDIGFIDGNVDNYNFSNLVYKG